MILFIGYRLYLEYQTDIQMFLDPRPVDKHYWIRFNLTWFSDTLFDITDQRDVCCSRYPYSVIGVLVGLSYGPLLGTLINVSGNAFGNMLSIFLMQHLKLFDHSKKSNR